MSAKNIYDAIREKENFKFLRIKFNENNSDQNNDDFCNFPDNIYLWSFRSRTSDCPTLQVLNVHRYTYLVEY